MRPDLVSCPRCNLGDAPVWWNLTAGRELIIDECKFKDQGGKATHLIPHILQLNCEVYCIGSSHYLPALHTLPSMSSGGIAIRRNLQLSCGSHYLSTLLPCYIILYYIKQQ